MAWSSRLCFFLICISVMYASGNCQTRNRNRNSSSTSTISVISSIFGLIFWIVVCIGCCVGFYRLFKNGGSSRSYARPPRTRMVRSHYSAQQQAPTVVYNTATSQVTTFQANAGSGQQTLAPNYQANRETAPAPAPHEIRYMMYMCR